LQTKSDFHKKQVEKNFLLIETIVRKHFGLNITIQCQFGSKPPSTKKPGSSKIKPTSAPAVNNEQDDPLVKATKDIFNAETE
jgi:hypothetical protein